MSDPLIDLLSDDHFMREAIRQARKAASQDEVPIGAVIVHEQKIIARAWNQVETLKDATAHAEMLALTQGAIARTSSGAAMRTMISAWMMVTRSIETPAATCICRPPAWSARASTPI